MNWSAGVIFGTELQFQNVQIARYLEHLESEGFARRVTRGSKPSYRLTRPGLLELISRIVQRDYLGSPGDFLFAYFFVSTYKPRIFTLVRSEGREFPPALKVELEALLDENRMLQRHLAEIKQELLKLEARISDALATSELTKALIGRGLAQAEIIREIEKKFPYELNSQKPLSELLQDIPENQRLWELEEGTLSRVRSLWRPKYNLLNVYLQQLEGLAGC
ncbi:MAG: hypothetical protein DCC75_09705 [Proteobacteria bacterium]|nr:MAG: hypothetical protein DCC75_09705 [Pseudomonadota bacterium]